MYPEETGSKVTQTEANRKINLNGWGQRVHMDPHKPTDRFHSWRSMHNCK